MAAVAESARGKAGGVDAAYLGGSMTDEMSRIHTTYSLLLMRLSGRGGLDSRSRLEPGVLCSMK